MNDIERFKFSFRNALSGIKAAFYSQRNLRIQLLVGILIILTAIIVGINLIEFSILLITILIVIVTELFNTAIEFTIDLISPEYHKLAKKVKDISAAAVLITAFFAILIGILILGSRILLILLKLL